MKCSKAVNRAKLVDEPIVEMILSRKYFNSGLVFMKSDLQSDFDGADLVCYSDGFRRNINVKRNSSKYYNSKNFTITINKNKLDVFKSTQFVFIDEVGDCLYVVDGELLCKYILDNSAKLRETDKENSFYMIIPKKDLVQLVGADGGIIRYTKAIANLFAAGRDESAYMNLF